MSELIFKAFIKDYNDTNSEKVRCRYGVLGGAVGIFLNVCLFIFKLIAGLLTSSLGILADALNNLSDAGSSAITLIGFKLSGKPADHEHPFGHGRIEYLSALFVSIAILLMGFELAKSSIGKIISPEAIEFKMVSVIILIAAILTKTWMFFFNTKIGKKISSQTMIATAKDSLSDCISTFAVLVSVMVTYMFKVNIDGFAGLLVACFILYTGYQTIKDSLSPLLGDKPNPELAKKIEQTVLAHKEILGIHDLIIHDYGPTRFMMSVHAEVSAHGNILEIHDVIDLVENELKQKFECDATIHMDPIETDNEIINRVKPILCDYVKSINDNISIHDFRAVVGPTHTNIIFDIVVPFGLDIKDGEIVKMIESRVKKIDETYFAVINVDKSAIM